ncbi:hypothetical protein WN51_04002 [Melipona quadrifasciata]|uniref:Uncharacterized protein n=1 Tax=Melipona quadrifasciata TaxID=166423 RepID=A0A0M8ZRJ5_9HYME|nr:hypothetical protein WN51_04002 [Melipona quadrifasciata]
MRFGLRLVSAFLRCGLISHYVERFDGEGLTLELLEQHRSRMERTRVKKTIVCLLFGGEPEFDVATKGRKESERTGGLKGKLKEGIGRFISTIYQHARVVDVGLLAVASRSLDMSEHTFGFVGVFRFGMHDGRTENYYLPIKKSTTNTIKFWGYCDMQHAAKIIWNITCNIILNFLIKISQQTIWELVDGYQELAIVAYGIIAAQPYTHPIRELRISVNCNCPRQERKLITDRNCCVRKKVKKIKFLATKKKTKHQISLKSDELVVSANVPLAPLAKNINLPWSSGSNVVGRWMSGGGSASDEESRGKGRQLATSDLLIKLNNRLNFKTRDKICLEILNNQYQDRYRTDELKKKATNYTVWSLVMVRNQLPAQVVKEKNTILRSIYNYNDVQSLFIIYVREMYPNLNFRLPRRETCNSLNIKNLDSVNIQECTKHLVVKRVMFKILVITLNMNQSNMNLHFKFAFYKSSSRGVIHRRPGAKKKMGQLIVEDLANAPPATPTGWFFKINFITYGRMIFNNWPTDTLFMQQIVEIELELIRAQSNWLFGPFRN